MEIFPKLFHQEINRFSTFSIAERKLLFSIALYSLIFPIFIIFINAFLWRQSHDFIILALYNIALSLGSPFGFYLNGQLLKRFSSNNLYSYGLTISGIIITAIIFLPSIQPTSIGLFGFIYGIASGVFWSNRCLLTLETTESNDRIYFSSLEIIADIIANIIIPVAIGYFILYGSRLHLYTPITGYKMLSVFMILVIIAISMVILSFTIRIKPFQHIALTRITPIWKTTRAFQLVLGMTDILRSFLPTVIVLYLLGNEQTLGFFQSLLAIIAAIVLYIITRSLKIKYRVAMLTACFLFMMIGTIAFSIFYTTPLGIIFFFVSLALGMPLLWISTSSLIYDVIDSEDKADNHHFSYLFDLEIYMNTGRIVAVTTFLLLLHFFSTMITLRTLPIILAISQLFLVILAKSIEKKKKQKK